VFTAHLDVCELRLARGVLHRERLAEAHLLRVEGEGLVEVLHREADVVHVVLSAEPLALRKAGSQRTTNQESRQEYD